MSDVNSADFRLIHTLDDVYGEYKGSGPHSKAGIEIEMGFFDPGDPGQRGMSVSQNKVVKNAAASALPGDWVKNEPTAETLEVSSVAAGYDDLTSVLDDTNEKINIVMRKAGGVGLKRSYFQELPDKSADQLLAHIVDIERYRTFFVPYRSDMRGFAEYFSVCKSNQVSVSYSDPDHMLENVRRLYYMAPFLFLLTDNSTGFSQGKRFTGHGGMTLRHKGLQQGRGGVPDYVFTAKSGEEYIRDHIAHVMRNPLFAYYDEQGVMTRLPTGTWTNFHELKERGLNTATNYYFAQTVLWPDVKIAALTGGGHRYEARMFGVGLHQHQTALLIVTALAFDKAFAAKVDVLLESYGFARRGGEVARALLMKSYETARNHNGKFFDIAYGTGMMADFAKAFADLIEPAMERIEMEDAAQPMLTICRTGCTDGKINRILLPELADVLRFQAEYEPEIFDDPTQCAKTLFERELRNFSRAGKTCRLC